MTSIEWLYKLSKQRELDKFDLEQAKEMHKQEIIDAYNQDRFPTSDIDKMSKEYPEYKGEDFP